MGADRRTHPGTGLAASLARCVQTGVRRAGRQPRQAADRHLFRRLEGQPVHRPGAARGRPARGSGAVRWRHQRPQHLAHRSGRRHRHAGPHQATTGRPPVAGPVVLAAARAGGPGQRNRTGRRVKELAVVRHSEAARAEPLGPCAG
ncbi:hypothetical protein G6F65_019864 [Rhizopus arrhizus]|nr:hypothetical protein G6F65_019864 [Rhizopus arrhizus]